MVLFLVICTPVTPRRLHDHVLLFREVTRPMIEGITPAAYVFTAIPAPFNSAQVQASNMDTSTTTSVVDISTTEVFCVGLENVNTAPSLRL